MESAQTEEKLALSQDEFLVDFEHWTREIAEELARRNFIVQDRLTPEHWQVIEFVHNYYRKYCRGPSVLQIAKATGFNSRKICELFPCGTVRGAYRLAGLPRPPGCA